MAKEKKRGFFSWLGFGKEEETQQPAEEQQQTAEVVAEPAVEESALDRAEAQAVETVAVTEQVAEQQQVEPELIEEPVIEPQEPEPVTAIVEEVLPEEITAPDVAPIEEEPQLEELALDEPELHEEAPLTDEELEALALAETYAEDAELAEATQDTVSDLPLAAAPIIAQEQERPTKEGFFARLKRSLVKTRENLGSGFISLFRGKKIDDDLFEELEEQLLIADVGVETTRRIITNLTQQANRKQLRDAEALYGLLKA